MEPASRHAVRLGPFSFDPDRGVLRRGSDPVHLRAKTFALLCYLAAHPGRVIPKEELLEALWPDVTVTEDSLTQTVRDLRRALGEAGAQALRTVARRGYLFEPDAEAPTATPPHREGPLDAAPRIVVLPFATHSPLPEDDLLVRGLVEEITQGLSRYSQLRTVARHSAFRFTPGTLPPAEAARQLDAGLFVDGVAHRLGAALHITVCLCETDGGRQVWGETFALDPETFREVQAAIPYRIVTRLTQDAARQVALRPASGATDDLGAWQHFVTAVTLLRQYGEGVNERGREHLLRALERDPDFALAHAYLALAEMMIARYELAPPEVLERALAHARQGVRIAPDEARCHAMLAMVLVWQRQHAAAEIALRRAIDLNPGDADIMAFFGYLMTLRGDPAQGEVWMMRAIRLNPLHPEWYHYDLALICQQMGRYKETIARIQCLSVTDAWKETRLASCCAMLDDREGVLRHLARAEALSPGWDPLVEVRAFRAFEHQADADRFVAEVARAIAMRDGTPGA